MWLFHFLTNSCTSIKLIIWSASKYVLYVTWHEELYVDLLVDMHFDFLYLKILTFATMYILLRQPLRFGFSMWEFCYDPNSGRPEPDTWPHGLILTISPSPSKHSIVLSGNSPYMNHYHSFPGKWMDSLH